MVFRNSPSELGDPVCSTRGRHYHHWGSCRNCGEVRHQWTCPVCCMCVHVVVGSSSVGREYQRESHCGNRCNCDRASALCNLEKYCKINLTDTRFNHGNLIYIQNFWLCMNIFEYWISISMYKYFCIFNFNSDVYGADNGKNFDSDGKADIIMLMVISLHTTYRNVTQIVGYIPRTRQIINKTPWCLSVAPRISTVISICVWKGMQQFRFSSRHQLHCMFPVKAFLLIPSHVYRTLVFRAQERRAAYWKIHHRYRTSW